MGEFREHTRVRQLQGIAAAQKTKKKRRKRHQEACTKTWYKRRREYFTRERRRENDCVRWYVDFSLNNRNDCNIRIIIR